MSRTPLPSTGTDDPLSGSLTTAVVNGLDNVDADHWDRLVTPGSAPLRHGFLSAWEKSELPGLESRPVISHRPGRDRPVAAAPGYYYDLDLVTVHWPAATGVMSALRKLMPRLLVARTYELGNPTPLTSPFLFSPSEDPARTARGLTETALEDAAARSVDLMLVQNTTTAAGPVADALLPLGFVGLPIPPTVVVDLPYDSFDEYLGAMRAQYRRRARQALGRSDDLRVEHLREFDHMAHELAAAWKLIYDRAREVRREILTPAFFAAVSKLAETSVLVLRRPDGSMAAFALLLEEGRWLSFLQCGFDAPAGRSEGAYFRLLYEIIRAAIDGGFAQLDLGITTLAPKLDVGGVPVPLFAFVRHRNPVLQRIIGLYGNTVAKQDDLRPRRVFKEAPPTAAEIVAGRQPPPT